MSKFLDEAGLRAYDELLKGYLPPIKAGTGTLSLTTNTGTASGIGSVALGVNAYATGDNAVSLNCGTYAKLSSSGFTNAQARVTAVTSSTITCDLNAVAANALKNYSSWNKQFYIVYKGTDYLISSVTITTKTTLGVITSGTATLYTPNDYTGTIKTNTYVEAIKFSDKGAVGPSSLSANSGLAEGELSCAINDITQARQKGSFAANGGSIADAEYATALNSSKVYGPGSTGTGNVIINSNGDGSFGSGHGNTLDAPQSAIFGFNNNIYNGANQAFVIGALNNSSYKRTFIGGQGNTAQADDQVILGAFANASATDYFVLGCGSGADYPKNAFKVDYYGTYGMGTCYENGTREVACTKLATEDWVRNDATGVIGYRNSIYGSVGSVMLYNSTNDGTDTFQIASVSGFNAVGLGKGVQANADMAFAANNQTTAAFGSSAAFGYKTITTANSQFVCGTGNFEDADRSTRNSDCLFRVSVGNKDGLAVSNNGTTRIGIKGNLYELYVGSDPGTYSDNTIYFIY